MRLLDRVLDVHQTPNLQRLCQRLGLAFQLRDGLGFEREGRERAGRIARVHPSLLDVLHDPGDEDRLAVGQGVGVHFRRPRQVLVDQHRRVPRNLHGVADVPVQLLLVADDLHGPSAEDVGGPDHDREADPPGAGQGFLGRPGDGVDRLGDIQLL